MKIYRAALSIALLLLAAPAWGCSHEYFTPQKKFQSLQFVVLAYPIGILNEPQHAVSATYTGPFRQRVQWQVLVSWKGKFRVGDIFLTQGSYNADDPCGSGALYASETKLLYLKGVEPFEDMVDEQPVSSMEDMKYLSRKPFGG